MRHCILTLCSLAACGGMVSSDPSQTAQDASGTPDAPLTAPDPVPTALAPPRPSYADAGPPVDAAEVCQPLCCLDDLWFQCFGASRARCDEHPEVALCEDGGCTAKGCP